MVFNVTQPIPASSIFYPTPAGGNFNGTTTYLNRTSSIYGSDSSQGTLSVWVRQSITGPKSVFEIYNSTTNNFISLVFSDGTVSVTISKDNTAANRLSFSSTLNAYLSTTKWYHILASWDVGFSAGSRLLGLCVDGIFDVRSPVISSGTSFTSTYSSMNISNIGVSSITTLGTYFNGDISELCFIPGTYMDISVIANIRKFISDTKRPVYLGSSGNLPVNSTPALFMQGVGTGFNINSGTGGNYTTNGTLGTPTTTPSNP